MSPRARLLTRSTGTSSEKSLHDMKEKYIIVNEIDNTIYDGTPIFDTISEAIAWWRKNSGRPSDIIVSFEKLGTAQNMVKAMQEFLGES